MTNREKLSGLSTAEFWEEINSLLEHQAEDYIDYVKYLDSEDPDITHFIRNQGECIVSPSQTEKIAAHFVGKEMPKSRHALFLRERRMYGEPYAVVFMEEKIYTVPFKNVTMIKEEENGD